MCLSDISTHCVLGGLEVTAAGTDTGSRTVGIAIAKVKQVRTWMGNRLANIDL